MQWPWARAVSVLGFSLTSACTQLSDPGERGGQLSVKADTPPSTRDGGMRQPDAVAPGDYGLDDGSDSELDAGQGPYTRPSGLTDAGSSDDGGAPSDDAGSSPPGTGAPCPSGVRFEDNCYRPSPAALSWDDARDDCLAGGAHLVAIDSAGEDAFVATLQGTSTWLGARDTELEGTFLWTDGRALSFANWGINQPDAFPEQNCIEKRAEPGSPWYDQPCDNLDFYVCERPLE